MNFLVCTYKYNFFCKVSYILRRRTTVRRWLYETMFRREPLPSAIFHVANFSEIFQVRKAFFLKFLTNLHTIRHLIILKINLYGAMLNLNMSLVKKKLNSNFGKVRFYIWPTNLIQQLLFKCALVLVVQ